MKKSRSVAAWIAAADLVFVVNRERITSGIKLRKEI